jgi:hypothetical protein
MFIVFLEAIAVFGSVFFRLCWETHGYVVCHWALLGQRYAAERMGGPLGAAS